MIIKPLMVLDPIMVQMRIGKASIVRKEKNLWFLVKNRGSFSKGEIMCLSRIIY